MTSSPIERRPAPWAGALSALACEPIPGGVRMHSSLDATPHGFFKLIFPLFLRKLTREEARNMRLIKAKVESL